MLRDCKIIDPRGICVSKTSSATIELIVAAAGSVSSLGGLWRISLEKGGGKELVYPLVTDLPHMPVGVAVIPSTSTIVFTAGKHLYMWGADDWISPKGEKGKVYDADAGDKGRARCKVLVKDVGAGLSGVYSMPAVTSVEANHTDVLYVIDGESHCIKQVSVDEKGRRQVITIVGRPTEGPSGLGEMGTARMVGLWQPVFACPAYNSFLVADAGNGFIRLVTDVYPYAEQLMPALRLVEEGWSFSIAGTDGRDRNARNILGTIACVHLENMFWDDVTEDIAQRTGLSPSAQQGPDGNVSRSARRAVMLWREGLISMIRRLKQEVRVLQAALIIHTYGFCFDLISCSSQQDCFIF
jgi:hypothetical protein